MGLVSDNSAKAGAEGVSSSETVVQSKGTPLLELTMTQAEANKYLAYLLDTAAEVSLG